MRKISMEQVQTGKLLLAEPFMMDPNFRRAVVLLCDHQDEGSMGFILNKPLKMNVSELVEDFPEFESEVYYGGPVSTDTIHYLHNVGELLDESREIYNGLYWGGQYEKLKVLIRSEAIKPSNIRFFVGYSGWSQGQLSDEMEYGSWVISEYMEKNLFISDPEEMWSEVMKKKGDTYSVISQMPDPICWN